MLKSFPERLLTRNVHVSMYKVTRLRSLAGLMPPTILKGKRYGVSIEDFWRSIEEVIRTRIAAPPDDHLSFYRHVHREHNKLADGLASWAIEHKASRIRRADFFQSPFYRCGCDGGSKEGHGPAGYWVDAWKTDEKKWVRVIACGIYLGQRRSTDAEMIAAIECWRAVIVCIKTGSVHFDRHSFVKHDFMQQAAFSMKFAPPIVSNLCGGN